MIGALSIVYVFLNQINTSADIMEDAYLSVIDNSADIESNTYDLMFDMRGYNFTGDEVFLEDATENLVNLQNEIDQIKVLAEEQPSLVELKDLIDEIEVEVAAFEYLMQQSKTTFDKIELNRFESDQRAHELFDVLDAFIEEQEGELLILIQNDSDGSDIETQYLRMTTVDEVNDIVTDVVSSALESQINDDYSLLDEKLMKLEEAHGLIESAKLITNEKDDLDNLDAITEDLINYESDIVALIEANDEIDAIKASIENDSLDLLEISALLFDDGLLDADAAMEEINKDISISISSLIGGIGLGIAVMAIILLFITTNITKQITFLAGRIDKIANYNLTKEVTKNDQTLSKQTDELGGIYKSLESMHDNFIELVTLLSQSSSDLKNNSNDTSQNSKDMVNQSQTQSQFMSQIVDTMNNMSASITEVADSSNTLAEEIDRTNHNVQIAKAKGNETSEVTNIGKSNMQSLSETMSEMELSIESLSQSVNNVGSSTDEIKNIVDIINGIANQTNLLALNAAIEAARAGEAGKGFAVVADEIRKLAEDSTNEANNIANVIEKIEEIIIRTVKESEENKLAISNGLTIVKQANHSFTDIYAAVEESNGVMENMLNSIVQINDMSQNMASIAEEQAASSEEILSTSDQVYELSKQIESRSTDMSQTADQLSSKAELLNDQVSKFVL